MNGQLVDGYFHGFLMVLTYSMTTLRFSNVFNAGVGDILHGTDLMAEKGQQVHKMSFGA